ncbi:MAG: O-antigen ligase family protein [Paludibacteraceae bacterium]|nr:O-antigen ligase family protein [Paludibacteraceae bacterium]
MIYQHENRIPFLEKMSYWSALLAAFSFAFPSKYMNIGYVLWMIIWSVEIIFRKQHTLEKLSKKNIHIYLLLGLVLWTAISLFWTENFSEVEIVFQRKASLLIFPFLVLFGFNKHFKFKAFLSFYILGAVLSVIVLLSTAIYFYLTIGHEFPDILQFYEAKIAPYKHRTFFCFTQILSLLFFYFLKDDFSKEIGKKLYWLTFIVLNLSALLYIFSAGGRMVLIIYFSVQIGLIAYELWRKGHKKKMIVFSVLLVSLFVFGLMYHPRMPEVENFNSKSISNVDPRVTMWTSSANAIADNFWLGVGVGDRKDVFKEYYAQIEVPNKYKPDTTTSSHNSFIDNQLELGVIGTLLLLGIIAFSITNTNKKNRNIILLLSVSWAMVAAIESIGTIESIYLFMLFLILVRCFKEDNFIHEQLESKLIQKNVFVVLSFVSLLLAITATIGRFVL